MTKKRAKLPSCYPMMGCHHLRRHGPVGVVDARGNTTVEEGPLPLAICPACNDWFVAFSMGRELTLAQAAAGVGGAVFFGKRGEESPGSS